MIKVRQRGEQIRQFILAKVEEHPKDLAALTAQAFGISRQAVNKHIKLLIEQKALAVEGSTRNRLYKLCSLVKWINFYQLDTNLTEDGVWEADIRPQLLELPDNVRDIWNHGFTEMLNNAIDHSSGKRIAISVEKTAKYTEIMICDDGEGIFKKIQRALSLHEERHAVLELAKGKLTTDPTRHSGEGIFFSSRMFDEFAILSGSVYFTHDYGALEDWIADKPEVSQGTGVLMKLDNNTARTTKEIFDKYSSGDNYGFTKTVVPVHLAQYGDEKLVSRSQAKRVLARIDRFKVAIFDFADVEAIGQSFADEVFRVFKRQHLDIELVSINANEEVAKMINRAETHLDL